MKFLKYLNKTDTDNKKLLAARLSLVESQETTKDILSNSDSETVNKINKLLENMNKSLDFVYKGKKYKVGLDLTDDNNLDKIKLDENKKTNLKEKWNTISSELAKIQMDL